MKIAGVDAVGLGSDFDGVLCVPENLDSVGDKIHGENLLRTMSAVEKTAKLMR